MGTEEDPELWECLSLTQLEKCASADLDNPDKSSAQSDSNMEKSSSGGSTPKRQKRPFQEPRVSVTMNPNVKSSVDIPESRRSPRFSRNKNSTLPLSKSTHAPPVQNRSGQKLLMPQEVKRKV